MGNRGVGNLPVTSPNQADFQTVFNTKSGLLVKLTAANMNVTTDQPMAITATKYVIRKIVVTNASTSLTLAAGGIYDAASKGGNALVAAAQVYSALTTSVKYVDLTLGVPLTGSVVTASTIFLSLTTAQGGAATADVYVFGDILT